METLQYLQAQSPRLTIRPRHNLILQKQLCLRIKRLKFKLLKSPRTPKSEGIKSLKLVPTNISLNIILMLKRESRTSSRAKLTLSISTRINGSQLHPCNKIHATIVKKRSTARAVTSWTITIWVKTSLIITTTRCINSKINNKQLIFNSNPL